MEIVERTGLHVYAATELDRTESETIEALKERSQQPIPDPDEWLDEEQRRVENSKLEKQDVALEFGPSDVRYIIVPRESQIHHLVKRIRNIKKPEDRKPKYDEESIEILTTRIISMEHILQDF